MPVENYTTTILVDCSAKEVFNTINNVRAWWQGAIEGKTDQLNEEFDYRMEDLHFSRQKIVNLIPDEKIVWLVTDSKLSFTEAKSEWTGTQISFDLVEVGTQTQVRFTHWGLAPSCECYGACSAGWGKLIQDSLYSLITTGKGKEVF